MNAFKRITAFLSALVLTAGCGTVLAGADETIYGDVDCNGTVNLVDVVLLNKHLMVGTELTADGRLNADVDVNGTLNAVDSLNILKACVDLVTLPIVDEEPTGDTEEPTTEEGETSYVLGDVNLDGSVDLLDVDLVLDAASYERVNNKTPLIEEQFLAADVDKDGILSAQDALYIMKYAALTGAGEDIAITDVLSRNFIGGSTESVKVYVDELFYQADDLNRLSYIPVYVRVQNDSDCYGEAIETSVYVSTDVWNFRVITDSAEALKYGGEPLDYVCGFTVDYRRNEVHFSAAAVGNEKENANLALLLVEIRNDGYEYSDRHFDIYPMDGGCMLTDAAVDDPYVRFASFKTGDGGISVEHLRWTTAYDYYWSKPSTNTVTVAAD